MITEQAPVNEEAIEALRETLGEVFDELKQAFIEDGEMLVSKAEEALKNQDYIEVGLAMHTLKSSARNMGAFNMADCCAEVETMIEKGQLENLDGHMAEIREDMGSVTQYLEQMA